jgi:DNA-binding CsgD family transcriptional regulator
LFSFVLSALNKPNKDLLVVFEDVQWADEATLDLLRYLGRRIERLAAVIIATYRDEEAGSDSPLTLALGDLATAPAVQRIELAPLSEHATSRLAERTDTDPAELHRRTGGNPFFITEVLASGGDRVPATVRDAVLARIARLAEPTRLAIEAAAAIGPRLDTELLEYVLDASALPRWSIRAALFTGILREDSGGLAFRHALAQSAIIESVPADRLQILHRLVLEGLLAGTAGPEIYSALVLHAEGAGDDDAVAIYAPLAAARAAAFKAHRESASLYERALSRGRKQSPARRAELIELRADQLKLGGDHQAALAGYELAAEIWRREDHTRGLGRCLLQIASLQFLTGQHAAAEKAEAEAIAYLEKLPPTRELAQAYESRARHRFMALNPSEAEEWAARAHTVSEQLGDTRIARQASVIVSAARLLVGDDGGRLALLSHLNEASEAGDIDLTARTAFYLSWLPMLNSNYEGVEEAFTKGIACADEHELDYWRHLMLAAHVRFCLDQCRWHEAEETALAILAEPASAVAVLPSLTALGRIGARRGESDCLRYLDRAREIAAAHPQLEAVTGSLPARVEAVWLTGDWNRAASEANSALAGAVGNGNPWWAGELICWLDRSAAEYSKNCNVGAPHALELAGNYKAAARWWEERGCRYEAALSGSRADDPDALVAAIGTFDALGAAPAASWARNRLRGLGIAAIPRGPRPSTSANPAHLTQREQEVLELVAGGCTNAEIGRQLFLSPKTVERHLSNVLGKLGVSSRSQAVDRAREVGALPPEGNGDPDPSKA